MSPLTTNSTGGTVREEVRRRYANAALAVGDTAVEGRTDAEAVPGDTPGNAAAGCCGPECCAPDAPIAGPAAGPADTVVADAAPEDSAGCCGPECCAPATATTDADDTAVADTAPQAVPGNAPGRAAAGCCGPGGCAPAASDGGPGDTAVAGAGFGAELYDGESRTSIPSAAVEASLGCGNPVAVADLRPGETVLDLGSGGGIDVLLSARRVGPDGFAYGLDMTSEMLELARRNQVEAGVTNVEFLQGYIEDIPLGDGSVDVVISNCVVNLSPDKAAVFAEIHRILRPGGRIGITDVVADDHLTLDERLQRGDWTGCIAGALSFDEYRSGLLGAGFGDVEITSTHPVADGMHSAIIRAVRQG